MMEGARDLLKDLDRFEDLCQAEDTQELADFIMEHHETWLRQGVYWWGCYGKTLAELVREREEAAFILSIAEQLLKEIGQHDVDDNIRFLAWELTKAYGGADS